MRPVVIVFLDPTGDATPRFLQVPIFRGPDFFFFQAAMEALDVRRCVMPSRASVSMKFRLILPAVAQRLSDAISPASLGNIPALHPFLHDLPLLFRGAIYPW